MNYPTYDVKYYDQMLNTDIGKSCPLKCSKCIRQAPDFEPAEDISLNDFKKIAETFPKINFCGTQSDPIYHPEFLEIFKHCVSNGNEAKVHTAGDGKSTKWWEELADIIMEAKPEDRWKYRIVFSIDGLPEDSHNHKIGQNGEQAFKNMRYLNDRGVSVQWQYIVFKYNENDVETARQMADINGIKFISIDSSIFDEEDELKPSNALDNSLQNKYNDIKVWNGHYTGTPTVPKVEKLYPKCMKKNSNGEYIGKPCSYEANGFVLPCPWAKKDFILAQPHLHISQVDSVYDITQSEEWIEFYRVLQEEPDNAPDLCKLLCSYDWTFKTKEMFDGEEKVEDITIL